MYKHFLADCTYIVCTTLKCWYTHMVIKYMSFLESKICFFLLMYGKNASNESTRTPWSTFLKTICQTISSLCWVVRMQYDTFWLTLISNATVTTFDIVHVVLRASVANSFLKLDFSTQTFGRKSVRSSRFNKVWVNFSH